MREAPIAITMGDPAGIGPEIIVRAFADANLDDCLVIGDPARLQQAAEIVGCGKPVLAIDGFASPRQPGAVPVVTDGPDTSHLAFGAVDALAGKASFDYLERAIAGARQDALSAIVTSPINKEAWSAAGVTYPGHTEVLAARSGDSDVSMMLANPDLRVVLVTIHVSLRDACDLITPERELDTIRRAQMAGRALGYETPRIAVAGLNPHAGEGGLFGTEDRDVIAPAIEVARSEGILASGPWSGDTVFARARKGEFDVVVAQTHDQGLIPVKYLGVDDGVNVTIGLPFVRTSPDHGTAFDIAGTGKASPSSLLTAIDYARRLKANRTGKTLP